MAWFDNGNPPINSTGNLAANPSTSTLIAELDSTQLGTVNFSTSQSAIVEVRWVLGSDSNAGWQCETATSTALGAGVDVFYVKTPTNQNAEYITRHVLKQNYRIRARPLSTWGGNGYAYISAEVLT